MIKKMVKVLVIILMDLYMMVNLNKITGMAEASIIIPMVINIKLSIKMIKRSMEVLIIILIIANNKI